MGRGENLPGVLGGQKQRTWLEEKVKFKFKLTRRINTDIGSCVTETQSADWAPPQQALPLDLQAGLRLHEALTPLPLVRELRHPDWTMTRGLGFLGNQNQYLQRLGSLGKDSVEMRQLRFNGRSLQLRVQLGPVQEQRGMAARGVRKGLEKPGLFRQTNT